MRRGRTHKYNAKKTVIDGITFDSKGEAHRYTQLKWLEKMGEITELELQPTFEILPTHKDIEGKTVRKMEYRADFSYLRDGERIIEDVKGVKTEAYKLKKKLVEYKYQVKITEVTPR